MRVRVRDAAVLLINTDQSTWFRFRQRGEECQKKVQCHVKYRGRSGASDDKARPEEPSLDAIKIDLGILRPHQGRSGQSLRFERE